MTETKPKKKPRRTAEEARAESLEKRKQKAIMSAIKSVPLDEDPKTGSAGKYNFPNARMKLIEQDDEKRAFLAKAIENNLAFFNVGLNPVKSDEQLCERMNYFFMECARTQQLPTVEKMANCIGYHRSTLYDWQTGRRPGFSTQTAEIIKKGLQILASMDAELAQEGKIQPVVYMFRAKNFYEMQDKQEMVLTPNTQRLSEEDAATIMKKYAELPEE